MKNGGFLKKIILFAAILSALLAGTVFIILYGSLPPTSGEKTINGLSFVVTVDRDKNGRILIKAKNRIDASLALGFMHGQDRFFQMDLLRRMSAGELSELFGKETIDFDKEKRFHFFKKVAKNIYNALPIEEKEILKAYTQGVNRGIESLAFRPFEYFLLEAPSLLCI